LPGPAGRRLNGYPRFKERFWLPAARIPDGFEGMGAKYYPTVKDMKASQRFLQKQRALPKVKKSPEAKPGIKTEKK